MGKERKLLLVILVIVGAILVFTWTNIMFTDNSAIWRHYLALILFVPLIFYFKKDFRKALLFAGIYLILGTCNLLTLTPSVTSNAYGIKIGSFEIWTPTFQLYSFLLLVLYFLVNFNTLIEYYLDYQDSKKGSKKNVKDCNKIEISAESAKEMILQGKPLVNFHIIGDFDIYQLENKIESEIMIRNCIVDNLISPAMEFKKVVYIYGSYFRKCSFYGAYFLGGLKIDNCVFESYLEFDAGGHNQNNNLFSITNSQFKSFVNFFDCWFQSDVEITNNKFEKGTNILGNKSEPYRVQFDISPIIQNNIGSVDLDGEGGRIVNTIIVHRYKE